MNSVLALTSENMVQIAGLPLREEIGWTIKVGWDDDICFPGSKFPLLSRRSGIISYGPIITAVDTKLIKLFHIAFCIYPSGLENKGSRGFLLAGI